ncbi:glyoxalase [Devosia sp. Root436]|jgi:catechol 2,3-dioxygenase-like lactoylglutathione lyase family enzyme|uniref:VOC family protein n=1 Tax=Devosia sp. Root436 TaxID=1736537 RepID=UPI0006F5FEA8|nr:VOC family protein [Devosia sp. Root436]KQX42681.1 glyoxalase [Devosia sp. Root436]
MIRKIECVCIPTKDIAASEAFYASLGLRRGWIIERPRPDGATWTLVGMKFPDTASSELVLSDNPDIDFTEVELAVDDVQATFAELRGNAGVSWIREPFATESGHVAVMEAPDGNVFVLVGA